MSLNGRGAITDIGETAYVKASPNDSKLMHSKLQIGLPVQVHCDAAGLPLFKAT